MVRKVKILDADTGQPLREAYIPDEKKIFGVFTVADLIKAGSVWIGIIGMVIGFDYRLKNLESDKIIVTSSITKMIDFVKASDTFNSSTYGVQFDNGKPINPSYEINNRGNLNQKGK